MIPNEETKRWWHYLAVKKLSSLLHRITSKINSDFDCLNCLHSLTSKNNADFFFCLNCFHSFRTESRLIFYEKVCKIKDFYGVVMSSEKETWKVDIIGHWVIGAGY